MFDRVNNSKPQLSLLSGWNNEDAERTVWMMEDLPKVWEPFDQLGGVVLVELDVREVHLEDGGGRVPHPEEHQLRLPQVHRGEGGVLGVGEGEAAWNTGVNVDCFISFIVIISFSWHREGTCDGLWPKQFNWAQLYENRGIFLRQVPAPIKHLSQSRLDSGCLVRKSREIDIIKNSICHF